MLGNILFYVGLSVSLGLGYIYFRDAGDITQFVMKLKRDNIIRLIRNEYQVLTVGIASTILMFIAYFFLGGGTKFLFLPAALLLLIFYLYPWTWSHLILRDQRNSAKYYSIEEAKAYVSPFNNVVVIEKDGIAKAHPDQEIMRPHITGNDEGLNGEDVVMTYCAMSNVGIAYKPVIEGKKVDLEVVGQYNNNLIMRDLNTGEPIQQMLGKFEKDRDSDSSMEAWPSFRMTFRGFQKAYPEGKVFLNKPSNNPILNLLDGISTPIFFSGIARQHKYEKPIMENMTHYDSRLPNKTYIWGINIGEDAVCYTDDFIAENDGLINVKIGAKDIVLSYHPKYESVGAWYNDSGSAIKEIDFFGNSDQGLLKRVESLKSGMFWHVWVNFFPHTDINRVETTKDSDVLDVETPVT